MGLGEPVPHARAPAFGQDDVALLAELSEPLADRLRRFATPHNPHGGNGQHGPHGGNDPHGGNGGDGGADEGGGGGSSAPGLVLFDESGDATSINEEARAHLASLPDGPSTPSPLGVRLPIWLVARRSRRGPSPRAAIAATPASACGPATGGG